MDYTKVPRALIYKERTKLNDFGVNTPGTINNYLFTQMRRMTLLRCGDAKEIALRCFNNAYYICTLIQLEEFPDLSVDKYEALLLPDTIPFPEDVYQASMALVCVLLAAYDDKYKQKDQLLIESIHHWTSSNKWMGSQYHISFEVIIEKCSPDGFSLAPDTFEPRDIVEAVEDVNTNILALGYKYVYERLKGIQKKEKAILASNTIIGRINYELCEIYRDSGYNPETKKFEYEDDLIHDLDWESRILHKIEFLNEILDFFINHYPTKDKYYYNKQSIKTQQLPNADVSSAEISKLKAESNILQNELKKANQTIEKLTQPVEELTAKDKIRMAFALQLLKEAGLTDETIKVRGNGAKVARIMSFLLEIISKNNRGNSAQICQTFLSDSGKYYPQTQDNNTLIELNNLCSELGINVCLSMESQSNNKG